MPKTPREEPKDYNKVDVIKQHIRSSIQMIAMDCHPFSTHTIVMACKQLILDLAESRKLSIEWHHKFWIKAEYHKEFIRKERRAYNYFKHADQDPDSTYKGPNLDELNNLNELQTLFNISAYMKMNEIRESDFYDFCNLMLIRYPNLFRLDFLDGHPDLKDKLNKVEKTRSNILLSLRMVLFSNGFLPRIPPF